MNYLDYFLLIILIWGAINGFQVGLIRALANLLGWVIALFCAINFYADVQKYFVWTSEYEWIHQVVAFTSIILSIIFLSWFISWILQKILQQLRLAPLNRVVGGLFGLFRNILVILVFLHILTPWFSQAQFWKQSQIVQNLLPFSPVAMEWSQQVSQHVIQSINDEELLKKVKSTLQDDNDEKIKNPFSP